MIAVLAQTPQWVKDLNDVWYLILGTIAAVGWMNRRKRKWMETHISGPIQTIDGKVDDVDKKVESLGHRVHTLEIVHNTEDVSASEITRMLGDRRRGGQRRIDPTEGER